MGNQVFLKETNDLLKEIEGIKTSELSFKDTSNITTCKRMLQQIVKCDNIQPAIAEKYLKKVRSLLSLTLMAEG